MIDSSTGEANTHMYWTGFTLITCKNSIAGPIVNTQSVVVLVWIILGVSIKPGLCYDIPESLYGRTGIPYREHRTAVYRYIGILLHPYLGEHRNLQLLDIGNKIGFLHASGCEVNYLYGFLLQALPSTKRLSGISQKSQKGVKR